MTTLSLEERVAALEAKIAQLTREQQGAGEPPVPWWEQRFGAFAESAEYEEALRLGREYRESPTFRGGIWRTRAATHA